MRWARRVRLTAGPTRPCMDASLVLAKLPRVHVGWRTPVFPVDGGAKLPSHEAPGAGVGVVGELVALVERDRVGDEVALERAPGRVATVLGEDAAVPAGGRGTAIRAYPRRGDPELVVLDEHVLRLPPAVAQVGLHLDKGGGRSALERRLGVDHRAVVGAGVVGRAAEPVGVLPEDDAAPVVDEDVVLDLERARLVVRVHPAVGAGLRDVDRAGGEAARVRTARHPVAL